VAQGGRVPHRRRGREAGRPLNLNNILDGLTIYSASPEESETIALGLEDISATVKADDVEMIEGKEGEFEVEGYPEVSFSFSTGTGGT
jgi:hypothetical protein